MDRRIKECLSALASGNLAPRHAELAREILAPAKAPRKKLPGKSIAGKRAEKAAAHREQTREIREKVMQRASRYCERCVKTVDPSFMHLHHLLGGGGRRRQRQSADTTVALCWGCHDFLHAHPDSARAFRDKMLPKLAQHPAPTAATGGDTKETKNG